MEGERFLVTGALGCLGAWVAATVVGEGVPVIGVDLADDPYRLRYLLSDAEMAGVELIRHDILDSEFLADLMVRRQVTSVIHLAALQVPFCRADPLRGAQVNVSGTVAVFEAVRRASVVRHPLVYASSIAAYGAPDGDNPDGDPGAGPTGAPATHYGVYKRANEDGARVHFLEFGSSSIGLRPHVVYGVGRDQGVTSHATSAMLAAATGRPAAIPFSGAIQLHYARDAAADFVAAARSDHRGATVHNLGGPSTSISELVAIIEGIVPEAAGTIAVEGAPLPFPSEVSEGDLGGVIGQRSRTSLQTGVEETIARFRALHSAGRLRP